MPIDPAGTAPGLSPKIDAAESVSMRCKNPQCDSMLAIELKHQGIPAGSRMYQCTKCKHIKGVPVGGALDL